MYEHPVSANSRLNFNQTVSALSVSAAKIPLPRIEATLKETLLVRGYLRLLRGKAEHLVVARPFRWQVTEASKLPRGIGTTRLTDLPAEWSRHHQMLGLPSQ